MDSGAGCQRKRGGIGGGGGIERVLKYVTHVWFSPCKASCLVESECDVKRGYARVSPLRTRVSICCSLVLRDTSIPFEKERRCDAGRDGFSARSDRSSVEWSNAPSKWENTASSRCFVAILLASQGEKRRQCVGFAMPETEWCRSASFTLRGYHGEGFWICFVVIPGWLTCRTDPGAEVVLATWDKSRSVTQSCLTRAGNWIGLPGRTAAAAQGEPQKQVKDRRA